MLFVQYLLHFPTNCRSSQARWGGGVGVGVTHVDSYSLAWGSRISLNVSWRKTCPNSNWKGQCELTKIEQMCFPRDNSGLDDHWVFPSLFSPHRGPRARECTFPGRESSWAAWKTVVLGRQTFAEGQGLEYGDSPQRHGDAGSLLGPSHDKPKDEIGMRQITGGKGIRFRR